MKLEYIRLGDDISRFESSLKLVSERNDFFEFQSNIEVSFQGVRALWLKVFTTRSKKIFWVEFRTENMTPEECEEFVRSIDRFYHLVEFNTYYYKSLRSEFPGIFKRNHTSRQDVRHNGWFRMMDESVKDDLQNLTNEAVI